MTLLFYYFATVTVLAALLTVLLRNPVHCGIALLTVLLHVAGFFILLHAEFIAVVQIIIYAGAILVLYLFVVMLLNLKTEERHLHRRYALFAIAGGVIAAELLAMLLNTPYSGRPGTLPASKVLAVGHSQALGIVLFRDYLLQFEIVGVFLLGAIIGAVVLAKTVQLPPREAAAPPPEGLSSPEETEVGAGAGR